MFDINPDRPAQQRPEPVEPGPSRMPFAQAPAKPRSWWGTIPGQLALVAFLVGAIVIALGLMGVIGPRAMG